MLSYAKLRRVLSVFLSNQILRTELDNMLSGKEITELSFLDIIFESKADVEILNILTDGNSDDIPADEAIEVFTDFFLTIKASWQKLKPLLSSLGLKVETELTSTSKG